MLSNVYLSCHPLIALTKLQYIRDPLTSIAIAIRIACMAHFLISSRILQQLFEIAINVLFFSTNQSQSPCLYPFRALSSISHYKVPAHHMMDTLPEFHLNRSGKETTLLQSHGRQGIKSIVFNTLMHNILYLFYINLHLSKIYCVSS